MAALGLRKTSDVVCWTGLRMVPYDLGLKTQLWSTSTWWPDDPQHVLLSPGQFWATSDCPEEIFEILGWQGYYLQVVPWQTANWNQRRPRSTTWIRRETQSISPSRRELLTHKCIVTTTEGKFHLIRTYLLPHQPRAILRRDSEQQS